MTGKIRVSIVATALDANKSENTTVLNMVSRIQNRNTGYSDNLFTHSPRIDNNTLNSIDGATALKLDENFEITDDVQNNINEENINLNENLMESRNAESHSNDVASGVSIESASYIENNNLEKENEAKFESTENYNEKEYTPKLFSEENNLNEGEIAEENNNQIDNVSGQLFDQEIDEEDDFEIPAFLRKQKF